jgi:hypothetical protein
MRPSSLVFIPQNNHKSFLTADKPSAPSSQNKDSKEDEPTLSNSEDLPAVRPLTFFGNKRKKDFLHLLLLEVVRNVGKHLRRYGDAAPMVQKPYVMRVV